MHKINKLGPDFRLGKRGVGGGKRGGWGLSGGFSNRGGTHHTLSQLEHTSFLLPSSSTAPLTARHLRHTHTPASYSKQNKLPSQLLYDLLVSFI